MYDSFGDGWNGNVIDITDGGVSIGSGSGPAGGWPTATFGSFTFAAGSGSCAVYGCTDSTAANYDPTATDDDGTCCFDNIVTVNMYDSFGDGWNGNMMTVYDVVTGNVVASGITLGSGSSVQRTYVYLMDVMTLQLVVAHGNQKFHLTLGH